MAWNAVNIVINNLLYNPQAVARLLAWLNERYPFTQFHISRQIYMGVWDSLLYEGFSLAIGVTGTEALANTFSLDPLGSVQWRFVMAADHPLANVEEPLTEAQLRRSAVNIEDSARTLTKRVAWRLPGQKRLLFPIWKRKSPPIWRAWALVFCQNHFASQCSIINNWSAG